MTDTHDHAPDQAPPDQGMELDAQILITVQNNAIANAQIRATQLEAGIIGLQRTIAARDTTIADLEDRMEKMKKGAGKAVKTK